MVKFLYGQSGIVVSLPDVLKACRSFTDPLYTKHQIPAVALQPIISCIL